MTDPVDERDAAGVSAPEPLTQFPTGWPVPQYVPRGYRLYDVSAYSRGGFQHPNGVIAVYGKPRGEEISRLEWMVAPASGLTMAATHIDGVPQPTRETTLLVAGTPTTASYFGGQFMSSEDGPIKTKDGDRLIWSDHHIRCAVASWRDYSIAVRGTRAGGIDEFHLLAMLESLAPVSFNGRKG